MKHSQNTHRRSQTLFWTGIVVFIIYKALLFLAVHDVRWDEAVFLVMGKALFSGGAIGYWELIRPPLLPVLLGLLDLIGDPVVLGELVINLAAMTGAYLLYRLLRDDLDPVLAAGASLTLLFTTAYFWYSSMLFTGVPAATLVIATFYAYKQERYALTGLLGALAFLTRFPAGLALFTITLFLLYHARQGRVTTQSLITFFTAGAAPIIAWMAINLYVFNDAHGLYAAIAPITEGYLNAAQSHLWLREDNAFYYLKTLCTTLPVAILVIPGAYYVKKHARLLPLALYGVFTLIFFTLIHNDQWRFSILFLPGIIVLIGGGAQWLSEQERLAGAKHAARTIVFTMLAVLLVTAAQTIWDRPLYELPITEHQQYFAKNPINGTILVADPVVAYYAHNPARPIYYEYAGNLSSQFTSDVEAITLTPRVLACAPPDIPCQERMRNGVDTLTKDFILVSDVEWQGEHHYIFLREGKNLSTTSLREQYNLTS